jgi:hypothetical protein
MKKALLAVLFLPTVALAQTSWQRDCVTWWGGDIAKESRTKENCPSGKNHWDLSGTAPSTSGITAQQVILPLGGYLVIQSGNTVSAIQTSKTR